MASAAELRLTPAETAYIVREALADLEQVEHLLRHSVTKDDYQMMTLNKVQGIMGRVSRALL